MAFCRFALFVVATDERFCSEACLILTRFFTLGGRTVRSHCAEHSEVPSCRLEPCFDSKEAGDEGVGLLLFDFAILALSLSLFCVHGTLPTRIPPPSGGGSEPLWAKATIEPYQGYYA